MYHKNKLSGLWCLIFLFIFISACNLTPESLATESPMTETVEIAVIVTEVWAETPAALPVATATPTLPPSPTPTYTPTPPPTPEPTCPQPGTAVPFDYPVDNRELEESLLAFLNAGGQWDELRLLLEELEIKHDLVQADMNGNGVMETAVYALISDDQNYPRHHAWWIFQCASNQYDTIYETSAHHAYHHYFIVDDLNNNSLAEIIAVSGFAGSACTLQPQVWAWQDDKIVNLLSYFVELDIGCSIDRRILLQDINGNHLKEMILIGSTIGHLDRAPPRGITQTLTLENTGYELANTVFAPAGLRVHLLDDAQRALDAGDLALAVSFYTQAAHADMMTEGSYNFLFEERNNPAHDHYQRVFALFRLAVLHLVTKDREAANATITTLNEMVSENQPGYEFVVLTQIFVDAYDLGENLAKACESVTEYISEHYKYGGEYPGLTSYFYWGYNIAFYHTPDSICPIVED